MVVIQDFANYRGGDLNKDGNCSLHHCGTPSLVFDLEPFGRLREKMQNFPLLKDKTNLFRNMFSIKI